MCRLAPPEGRGKLTSGDLLPHATPSRPGNPTGEALRASLNRIAKMSSIELAAYARQIRSAIAVYQEELRLVLDAVERERLSNMPQLPFDDVL